MPNHARRRASRTPGHPRHFIPGTNGIESLNARFRQSTRRRGHFPNEQAALKVLYLVVQERRQRGGNVTGRINNWKSALNTLIMDYGDRLATN